MLFLQKNDTAPFLQLSPTVIVLTLVLPRFEMTDEQPDCFSYTSKTTAHGTLPEKALESQIQKEALFLADFFSPINNCK